jgi:hypothetical protein
MLKITGAFSFFMEGINPQDEVKGSNLSPGAF